MLVTTTMQLVLMLGYLWDVIARNMNWMYMGFLEWTIYRASNEDNFAFYIYYEGGLVKLYVGDCVTVRPSFLF